MCFNILCNNIWFTADFYHEIFCFLTFNTLDNIKNKSTVQKNQRHISFHELYFLRKIFQHNHYEQYNVELS